MKPNKDGKYRINFYLNPHNTNDKVIIDYLKQRYSATEYIKETIFNIAHNLGPQMIPLANIKESQSMDTFEVYESINELDEIEL